MFTPMIEEAKTEEETYRDIAGDNNNTSAGSATPYNGNSSEKTPVKSIVGMLRSEISRVLKTRDDDSPIKRNGSSFADYGDDTSMNSPDLSSKSNISSQTESDNESSQSRTSDSQIDDLNDE